MRCRMEEEKWRYVPEDEAVEELAGAEEDIARSMFTSKQEAGKLLLNWLSKVARGAWRDLMNG